MMSQRVEPTEGESQVYVLRMWRENGHAPWRTVLRLTTGERIVFADLEQLVFFLLHRADKLLASASEGTYNECDHGLQKRVVNES